MSETTNAPTTAASLKEKLAARRAATQTQLVPAGTIAQLTKAAESAQAKEEVSGAEAPQSLMGNATPFDVIKGFNGPQFLETLDRFKKELEAKAPGIPTYLREIHKNLNQYQELAYLLTDEQLNLVCSGFFHVTDVKMAEVVVKSKSKKAAVTLDEAEKLFG